MANSQNSHVYDLHGIIYLTRRSSLCPSFSSDVPKEQRLQAVRAAILLMPDENREVLQTLLCFLRDVTSVVEENQMTPMNLAVCLGPSLFHLSILKSEALSPRCVRGTISTVGVA